MRPGIGFHRVPRSRPGVIVSDSPSRFSTGRRSPSLSRWVHPLVRFPLLQSPRVPTGRPHRLPGRPTPPLGFHPPSRRQQVESTLAGVPLPASFRPRRFARPRRLPPPPTLRVYFTPLPRPGFALQGLPLAVSRTGLSPAVALMSFAPAPYRGCPRRQKRAPAFRALLCLRVRCETWGFSPRPARSLPELLLLRVFLHVPRGRFRALSVHSLGTSAASLSRPRSGSQLSTC
jgi:hypothetical protein